MGNMKMGTSVIVNFNGHYQTVHSAPLPPIPNHPHPPSPAPTYPK